VLIWFLWPETSGRSLEELAFRKSHFLCFSRKILTPYQTVFENKEDYALRATNAVAKTVLHVEDLDKEAKV